MLSRQLPNKRVFSTIGDRRRGGPDRRRTPRPGHTGRRAADLARAGVLVAVAALFPSIVTAAEPMRFGMDVTSAQNARTRGMAMTYGSLWAGAWNQKWGWGGIESQLQAAKAAGLTPVIQWWYWGDDISPACVENGCWDARQGVQKDKATWNRMSNELADLIVRVLGPGSPTLVIVETEFNKGGIETYEPFDGYLAAAADIFHQRNLQVIVSFGNWGRPYWTNFDRAVARADLLGTMVLQSSVHQASTYLSGADMLIEAAGYLQSTFGKPCFVTDFDFSSYPAPGWEAYQDTIVKMIFSRLSELKAAGVRGMVWRMLADDPTFDTSNYHGMAERYWGLLRADGSEKPAYSAFWNGVQAETAAPAPVPVAPTGLTASGGDGRVSLSWNAVNGATYNVKSSTTSGGPYQTIAIGLAATAFTNTGLANGVTYYYVVSASSAAGESVNSGQASAATVAPPPAPTPAPSPVSVWWPTDGASVSGVQPFKALVNGSDLWTYKMYWQVDGGQLNLMRDNYTPSAHKEVAVDVSTWRWKGQGPYLLKFVAKDLKGKTIAERSVSIYVP